MRRPLFHLAFSGLVIASSAVGLAADLVRYDFSTPPSNSDLPYDPDAVASNVTVSSLTFGGGAVGNYFNTNAGFYVGENWSPVFDPDVAYATFSITPEPGFALQLDTLSFTWAQLSFNTPLSNLTVRWSLDGFSSDLLVDNDYSEQNSLQFQSIGLTAFPPITETVSFRFYAWGNSVEQPLSEFDEVGFFGAAVTIDELSGSPLLLTGSVTPIPEPSSVTLLLGAASAALVGIRRRRPRLI